MAEGVRTRLSFPLAALAFLVLPACSAPATDALDGDLSADAVTTEDAPSSEPATPSEAAAEAEPAGFSCAAGAALSDAALLARAPQGRAAVVTVVGRLRIATRTCEGERCVAELPREQPDVAVTLSRTAEGGTWRGQLSPSASTTLALEVGEAGVLSGELVTFGDAASTASVAGNATTACFGAKATAKGALVAGKRVETSVWFFADTPAELPRVAVGEDPPVPACDQGLPVDWAFQAYSAAGGNMSSAPGAVLEQFRDCRAPTGCLPWQVAPVNPDGSSPWATTTTTMGPPPVLTLTARTNNNGRNLFATTITSSANASVVLAGFGGTFTTAVPLLGRPGSADVKLTPSTYVVREAGGARTETSDPRVRSRRYVCLPYVK